MGRVAESILDIIGGTPLVSLARLGGDLDASILAKLEFLNPGGSVKDRIGLSMLSEAEKNGQLRTESSGKRPVVVEPTGGNTGVSLAIVSAIKGYDLILTMPETMSHGRIQLLRNLGAEVILTPGSEGMGGAIKQAREILREHPDYFSPDQFDNQANPAIHRETTAQEIWDDTDGKVDAIVAGVGTGGTVTGLAEALKAKNGGVKVFAVEPAESAVITGGRPGRHGISGIGAGFIPAVLNLDYIDEVIPVATQDAVCACRRLAREEGIIAGISSGAAVTAAIEVAGRDEFRGGSIVAVLADRGERYLEADGNYQA